MSIRVGMVSQSLKAKFFTVLLWLHRFSSTSLQVFFISRWQPWNLLTKRQNLNFSLPRDWKIVYPRKRFGWARVLPFLYWPEVKGSSNTKKMCNCFCLAVWEKMGKIHFNQRRLQKPIWVFVFHRIETSLFEDSSACLNSRINEFKCSMWKEYPRTVFCVFFGTSNTKLFSPLLFTTRKLFQELHFKGAPLDQVKKVARVRPHLWLMAIHAKSPPVFKWQLRERKKWRWHKT